MDFQPGRAVAPVAKVELSISCKSLRDRDAFSKSDPMAVVFMKEFGNPRFVEIGRTEVMRNNLSPVFDRKFLIDYHFEESQSLKFEIYDVDSATAALNAHDFLGRIECSLGEIVGAPGGKIHKTLTGQGHGQQCARAGSIIVCAEEVGSSKEVAIMQWKGEKLDKKDFMGKSDPFIQIFRVEPDGSTKLAYRSEVVHNTLNPMWKPFRVPVRNLCGDNNVDRTLRFECYDWDNDGGQAHDLIGMFETSYRKLSQGANNPQNIYDLINPKKKAKKKDYKSSGQLHLTRFNVETEFSFLDFIRGGTQLHFSVAVDFTASNGEPKDPKSLHYIHPQFPNQYMIALKGVGEIIQDYDYDKLFPALGFGAKLPPYGTLSHEFFLNFTNDPRCYGVNGILDAYRQSLTSVQLYGPTNFSPVIKHVARIAANSMNGNHYFILLIITDGAITDIDNTIDSIIHASSLPMSIIIVGVGDANFDAMEFLDSDKGRLQRNGQTAQRDIVQFVPMRNYVNRQNFDLSQARLAKDVLAEVPQQLTGYMKKMGIKPRPPVQVDVSQPTPAAPNPDPQGPPAAPTGPSAPGPGAPADYGQQPHGGPAPPPQQGPSPYPAPGQAPSAAPAYPGEAPAPYPGYASGQAPHGAPSYPGSAPAPYPGYAPGQAPHGAPAYPGYAPGQAPHGAPAYPSGAPSPYSGYAAGPAAQSQYPYPAPGGNYPPPQHYGQGPPQNYPAPYANAPQAPPYGSAPGAPPYQSYGGAPANAPPPPYAASPQYPKQ